MVQPQRLACQVAFFEGVVAGLLPADLEEEDLALTASFGEVYTRITLN
jgi:hypothetical protein